MTEIANIALHTWATIYAVLFAMNVAAWYYDSDEDAMRPRVLRLRRWVKANQWRERIVMATAAVIAGLALDLWLFTIVPELLAEGWLIGMGQILVSLFVAGVGPVLAHHIIYGDGKGLGT